MADKRIDIVIGAKVAGALKGIGAVTTKLGKITAIGAAGGAAGFAGLSLGAIKAAGDFEALKLRLEAVTGSAAKAEQQFADTFALFLKTPLDLEPLIEAQIKLDNIGIQGTRALETLAGAASALGRDVNDVTSAFVSMETEPLRNMGITLKAIAGSTGARTISFFDRMGKEVTKTAKDAGELRMALLDIFDIKYGGFLGKLSASLNGLISSFKGLLKAAFGEVGNGLLPYAKTFVATLNEGLQSGIESGSLANLGKKIGEGIKPAFVNLLAFGKTLIEFFSSGGLSGSFGRIKDILRIEFDYLSRVIEDGGKVFAAEIRNAFPGGGKTDTFELSERLKERRGGLRDFQYQRLGGPGFDFGKTMEKNRTEIEGKVETKDPEAIDWLQKIGDELYQQRISNVGTTYGA